MAEPIRVPTFARLADWVGAWAIEPTAGAALLERVRRTDLSAHIAAATPNSPTRAQAPAGSVAVVRIAGTMMKGPSSFGGASTVRVRRDLREAAADPGVSAIFLHIDSPGGTVAGTADLAADVAAANARKPVVAFIEDMGASAAYWVASQASKVYANSPEALVGSIGTLMVVYDLSGAAEQAGVKTLVFATGDLKGAGAPGAAITEGQQTYMQGLVDSAQQSFDAAVRSGRRFTVKQLAAVRSGAVFPASEAVALGLIDGIRTTDDVLAELRGAAVGGLPTAPRGRATMNESIVDLTDPTADAVAAERNRVDRIHQLAGRYPALARMAVAENWSPEKAELEALRKAAQSAALPNHMQAIRFGNGHGPGGLSDNHLVAGLMVRCGLESGAVRHFGEQVVTEAKPYHRASLVDVLAAGLAMHGFDVPRDRGQLIASGISNASISTILSNVANKVAFETWQQSPGSWRSFAAVRTANDFKANTGLRPTWGGELSPVGPGGDVKHGTIGEATYSWQVHQFAKQYGIDRTHLVNDDLSVLTEVVPGLARAAIRMTSNLVWATILEGVGSHFVAGNSNTQTGAGSVLAAAGLAVALKQMRMQTDPSGGTVDIMPKVLVTGATLEPTARTLLNSMELMRDGTADNQPTGNPFNMGLSLEVEPRIEAGVTNPRTGTVSTGSATRWFLFAGSQDLPVVVAYLNGVEAPQVETFGFDSTPDRLAMSFRIVLDVGCALADPKAGQHSAGA